MLTDTRRAMLEPQVEQCLLEGKTRLRDLRRTLAAILWRHQDGTKWRAVLAELRPWLRAAQTFICWVRLGISECLLILVQERGVQLGMSFPDGTSGHSYHEAAGAWRRRAVELNVTIMRHLAALAVAMAPRLAWLQVLRDVPSRSALRWVRFCLA